MTAAAPLHAPSGVQFVKGHGTENDFVLLPDPDGTLELTGPLVRAICDRRSGIGADGVLRVVRTARVPEAVGPVGEAEWFMDYRNADGSLAEMCGNGIRVYARYLVDAGLARSGQFALATRGGLRTVELADTGEVTVDMGPASVAEAPVTITYAGRQWAARQVDLGNPHAVVFPDEPVDRIDLSEPPELPPGPFPQGANLEFATVTGPRRVRMRVHERGVGETRSCGTGACAVAAAAAARTAVDPSGGPADGEWTVDLPGGRLRVGRIGERLLLRGPAVLVARGELAADWIAGTSRCGSREEST